MILPTHRTDIQIRFADINPARHVSNVVIVAYLEQARFEWLLAAPSDPPDIVVARLALDYLAEILPQDRVHVLTRCTRKGTRSLDLEQAILVGERKAATATSTIVAFDNDARRSIPFPAAWASSDCSAAW